MHQVLQIQEIVSTIFGELPGNPSDLASLARTCHTFKEPALDVLWNTLHDFSPVVRCLPQVSEVSIHNFRRYSRPLTDTEWDILRSYTRRIRSIAGNFNVDLRVLFNPPTTEPLFLNLRYLHLDVRTAELAPLLRLSLPALISFSICFWETSVFREWSNPFPTFHAGLKKLSVYLSGSLDAKTNMLDHYVCHWRNLQTLVCPQFSLSVDTLVRLTVLTELDFTMDTALPAGPRILFFNLRILTIHSKSLAPVQMFLSRTQLPTMADFTTFIDACPSKMQLSSFMADVQKSAVSHVIQRFILCQRTPLRHSRGAIAHLLCLDDVRPCMAFSNLHHIHIDMNWDVRLTDDDLLTLGSAWPYLEELCINQLWGWNTHGGITPNGLLHLLQTLPSLSRIAVAIDTREFKHLASLASLGSTWPRQVCVDVVDSVISSEAVPLFAAFFARFLHPSSFHRPRFYSLFVGIEATLYEPRWESIRVLGYAPFF